MDTIDSLLTGHRKVRPPEREPILIDPEVVTRLRNLLFEPEFRGVGYSAFIERACEVAETAIVQKRIAERPPREPGEFGGEFCKTIYGTSTGPQYGRS